MDQGKRRVLRGESVPAIEKIVSIFEPHTEHGELESFARRHAEALAVRKTKREYEMLALSASERLASWRAEYPSLDGRITRRLLASYLGITPEHLSRIRSQHRRTT